MLAAGDVRFFAREVRQGGPGSKVPEASQGVGDIRAGPDVAKSPDQGSHRRAAVPFCSRFEQLPGVIGELAAGEPEKSKAIA